MPSVTIELPASLPMLAPNSRLHRRAEARAINEIRQAVAWRARGAGIPTGLSHIAVECFYRPAEERYRFDLGNLWGAGIWKAAKDALHGHGSAATAGARGPKHPVVANDTPEFMTEVPAVQVQAVKGKPRAAWLVVSWADAEAEEVVPV